MWICCKLVCEGDCDKVAGIRHTLQLKHLWGYPWQNGQAVTLVFLRSRVRIRSMMSSSQILFFRGPWSSALKLLSTTLGRSSA
jgi:hypothetical protein